MDNEMQDFIARMDRRLEAMEQQLEQSKRTAVHTAAPEGGRHYTEAFTERDYVAALDARIATVEDRLQRKLGSLERQLWMLERQTVSLRSEMADQTTSVAERFRTLTMRVQFFEARVEGNTAPLSEQLMA